MFTRRGFDRRGTRRGTHEARRAMLGMWQPPILAENRGGGIETSARRVGVADVDN